MRKAGFILGFGLLLAVAAVSIDWGFWSRYLARPQTAADLSVDSYQPQFAVKGDYVPLARASSSADKPFEAAVDIAEGYNSSALLIASGDEIILERYWDGASASTRHLTFSFHKTISALLLGKAIDDGYISGVDASVGNYITRWEDDPRGRPTLRSVMQMSAGYSQPNSEGGPFSQAAYFSFGSDIEEATLAGDIAQSSEAPVFDYSDRNAQILGLALQSALPSSYEAYLSQVLWQPLHASDAAVTKRTENGPTVTYCCLMATAEDWLRIGMLLRDRGLFQGRQVIPAQWIDDMTSPAAANANFGLFLWLGSPFNPERAYTSASPARVRSEHPFAVHDVLFLDGAGGQRIYISRALDLVVVRIGEYRADWDDTRLFNAVAGALQVTNLKSRKVT
ncbi:serine hydrolase domain-containing protein [Altererythrobacter sp. GH1-8]|uniref:serine hydrolase domain-containing protein n=1 Tax=Altererythrobacter sp. GH1-8 TaxID=3349333 RepID=UPI00374CFAE6